MPRRSPNSARRSGSSPTTPWLTPTSATPCATREAGRGDRRIPRGDPAQARLRRLPLQPRPCPERPGEAWPRRSPSAARRSGSSPTTPRPTTTSATLLSNVVHDCPRRSPNSARRSGSSPTTPRPTATSATPYATRGSWPRRSPNIARRSGSSPTSPRPTSTSAPSCVMPCTTSPQGSRVSRGDPAQARPRRGPHQPRHRPARQGKLDEAIAEFREAIRLKPDHAEAHYNLGIALEQPGEGGRGDRRVPRGDPAPARPRRGPLQPRLGASAAGPVPRGPRRIPPRPRAGLEAPGWRYPSAGGSARPSSWSRWKTGSRPCSAATTSPGTQPRDSNSPTSPKHEAVRSISPTVRRGVPGRPQAGRGHEGRQPLQRRLRRGAGGRRQGDDKPPLDEKEKARWRKQALDWLKADLAYWTKQADTGTPQAKALVSQTLQHWKADTDLAGIRDEPALEALPEDERKTCRALWAEVDAPLAKARAATASRPHR